MDSRTFAMTFVGLSFACAAQAQQFAGSTPQYSSPRPQFYQSTVYAQPRQYVQQGVQAVQSYTHVYTTAPTFQNFPQDRYSAYIIPPRPTYGSALGSTANALYLSGRLTVQAADAYTQIQYNKQYQGTYFPGWGR